MLESLTSRGFPLVQFCDHNGAACSLQHSMNRPGTSALWFGPDGSRAHLNREQVRELRDRLTAWLDHGTIHLGGLTPPVPMCSRRDAEIAVAAAIWQTVNQAAQVADRAASEYLEAAQNADPTFAQRHEFMIAHTAAYGIAESIRQLIQSPAASSAASRPGAASPPTPPGSGARTPG